jgi:gliding motility-associated-like protein
LNAANIPNPIAKPSNSTTYQVVGFDAFNCFTDTGYVRIGVGPIPTLELGAGALVVAGTAVTLNPVTTGGPIRDYIWSLNTLLSCNNCPNPVATINNNIVYSLKVITHYGCSASDTIGYRVFCKEDQIFIPNGFSPDGDGINDIFYIMGKGVSRIKHFRVFNRFGQVVFERNNFNVNDPNYGWDGKINGVPASPDVYVYTADVVCTAGAEFPYKGNVILVR